MTLAGKTWTLDYSSTGSLLDADASRVTNIKDGGTTVCRYWYLGEGDLVGREYSGASIKWNEWATGTPPTYPDRDQFNRITSSRWTKSTNAGPVDFVDLDVAYDRASSVVSVKDNIYPGFDVLYSNDGLNRLTDADEGTLSSGSISSRKRRQLWTLSQTGNWPTMQLDLDGNGNYAGICTAKCGGPLICPACRCILPSKRRVPSARCPRGWWQGEPSVPSQRVKVRCGGRAAKSARS